MTTTDNCVIHHVMPDSSASKNHKCNPFASHLLIFK